MLPSPTQVGRATASGVRRNLALAWEASGLLLNETLELNEKRVRAIVTSAMSDKLRCLPGKSGVREGAHLTHRVTPKTTQRRVGRGVPMRSGRDADRHATR